MAAAPLDTSFFWHDYETWGRVPRFDRPAQFAGLRTDAELNEIGEPVNWLCQPLDDTLPDPEACLLTGLLPQRCRAEGLPEPVFAAAIEQQLSLPGTVGVGYNTLRFDDEVTRHLLWRNLRDPYAREWRNGCGRWDLVDLVRAAYALRPEALQWPTGDDGRVSFKLERLSAANGLLHEAAHDALSDVRATLALARRIRQTQPKLFAFALKLRRKEAVWAEIGGTPRPLLHVSGRYGVERGGLAMVFPLAPHPRNKNELIVWDLSADPAELFDLRAEAIRARLFVRQDELPEGVQRLPIKTIHVNKSPFVCASLSTLRDEQAERWGLDRPQALRHAEALAARVRQLDGQWDEVFLPHAGEDTDAESQLYSGFVGEADRRQLARALAMPATELAERVRGGRLHLEDPRLNELLWRYRARHQAEALDADERARWAAQRRERLDRGGIGRLSLAQFLDRIDQLQADREDDEAAQALLGELVDWADLIGDSAA